MNKSSLKIFAIDARKELMEKMRTRLEILGITKNGIEKAKVVGREVEINGSLYPKESYNSLVRKYKQIGYEELQRQAFIGKGAQGVFAPSPIISSLFSTAFQLDIMVWKATT